MHVIVTDTDDTDIDDSDKPDQTKGTDTHKGETGLETWDPFRPLPISVLPLVISEVTIDNGRREILGTRASS